MQEEIFISGRNIPKIDPYLEVWHFPISLYLFLGGMAAGIIFFASLFTILKREKQVQTAIKPAMIIVLFALSIGLLALFYDLTHKLYVWRLYTTIRIESPMSWGAWVLLLITIGSFLWGVQLFFRNLPKMEPQAKSFKEPGAFSH